MSVVLLAAFFCAVACGTQDADEEAIVQFTHNREAACDVIAPVVIWNATRLVELWINGNVIERRVQRRRTRRKARTNDAADSDAKSSSSALADRIWPSQSLRRAWSTLPNAPTATLHDAAWSRIVRSEHDDWSVVARSRVALDGFLAVCSPLIASLARSRSDRDEALVVRLRRLGGDSDAPYALTSGAASRLSASCGSTVPLFFGEPIEHYIASMASEWRSDHHGETGCEIMRVRDATLNEAISNPRLFERTYMQPSFLAGQAVRREVCVDAYAVHIFNKRFCDDMIEMAEAHGNFTQKPEDSYPTEDITLDELKWSDQWESLVRRHIVPLMESLYDGTNFRVELEPFVVRYITTGQFELEPHQDKSKVTSVVTLSNQFEGGGVRFTRQNCTFISKTLGLTLFHPGLVTHEHAGLPITSGRRYIFVSFNL